MDFGLGLSPHHLTRRIFINAYKPTLTAATLTPRKMSVASDPRPLMNISVNLRLSFPRTMSACSHPTWKMPSSSGAKKLSQSRSQTATQDFEQQKLLSHEQRRRTFLRKVHERGNDIKWDARSEQVHFLFADRVTSSPFGYTITRTPFRNTDKGVRFFVKISWSPNDSGVKHKIVQRLLA